MSLPTGKRLETSKWGFMSKIPEYPREYKLFCHQRESKVDVKWAHAVCIKKSEFFHSAVWQQVSHVLPLLGFVKWVDNSELSRSFVHQDGTVPPSVGLSVFPLTHTEASWRVETPSLDDSLMPQHLITVAPVLMRPNHEKHKTHTCSSCGKDTGACMTEASHIMLVHTHCADLWHHPVCGAAAGADSCHPLLVKQGNADTGAWTAMLSSSQGGKRSSTRSSVKRDNVTLW